MNEKEKKVEYIQMIKNNVQDTGSSLYIFGCGDLGEIGNAVFQHFHIPVKGFIASKKEENMRFQDLEVFTPEEIADKDKVYVAVCVFRDEVEKKITEQLSQMGYAHFVDKNCLLYLYLKLSIKPTGFTLLDTGEIIGKAFTLAITEFCSLKCKYCGEFTPYIPHPEHLDMELCIRPIQRITKILERIQTITIIGGEPLLHPQLTEICRKLLKISNVGVFSVVSNGTIMPSEELLELIAASKNRLVLNISDYGKYNTKIDSIRKKAKEYGINIEKVRENGLWDKGHIPEKRGRSREDNRNLYATCISTDVCPFMFRGRLYKCMTAGIGERFGFTPFIEKDSIDFYSEDIDLKNLKEIFTEFITMTDSITACDYCYKGELERIPMGEQIMNGDCSVEALRRNLQ